MDQDKDGSEAGDGRQAHDHGHEHGHEHKHEWKLNVQGVVIKWPHPTIVVREAIKLAGFDPDAGWIIVLKIAGEPKREVNLTTVVDLKHPGIEKLRLTPRQINNGEALKPRRLDFVLLPQDDAHLEQLGHFWETALDGARRWVLIRGYPLPTGYNNPVADIAIEIPVSYPGAQLDMFYVRPHLTLRNGGAIPQTQHTETVLGVGFQRWSRHRQWDSARDTLATHLALVDEALRREVDP